MKYKRGSIVEVLTTNKGKEEERVPEKLIRPCPPTFEISQCWPGDVVEVFHNLSWKMAIVSKSFNWDLFLVRLVGSCIEIEATKSDLRVRQSWQNNKWDLIGNRNKKHILKTQRETNDDDGVTSSVGSCSIDNKYYGLDEIEGRDSDGESVCYGGDQEIEDVCFGKKKLGLEIHRLELKAYRRTIQALHASGPLSWQKESMVTNLRMSLHISNDEHLIEIKNLISSASSIRDR